MAELPTYAFLPWARQGLATKIAETDTLGGSNGIAIERAELHAVLELRHTGTDDVVSHTNVQKILKIVGPGDLSGIIQKAIVRTQPKTGVANFEANGLAYIEFYEEDFLWRYTPAAPAGAGASSKLRPWLALVVLQDDEYNLTPNPSGPAYITVKEEAFNGCFHHHADHWAFGHVQFNDALAAANLEGIVGEINSELKINPDVAVSRLLCPRKLQKNTAYAAFLIPAFETGRLQGLGIAPTGIAAQTPSWKKGAMPASDKRPFDFPVYYQWTFRTGNYGDFESLATILKPIIIGKDQGKMPMDIQDPGFNLQTQPGGTPVIGFEAALKPIDMEKDLWPTNGGTNAEDVTTVDELKGLLSLSADFVDPAAVLSGDLFYKATVSEDPILVPPVYGVWHALVDKLDNPANPAWVAELNLDFRNRAAAGIGTTVVQQKQEDLMHRAWMQVASVKEANEKIRKAQMMKLITAALMKKHLVNAAGDRLLQLTDSVQHLVLNEARTQTVQQDFVESRIPAAAKTAAFRKLTRPGNKTASAAKTVQNLAAKPVLVQSSAIIQQFNKSEGEAGAVTGAKLKTAPLGALSLANVTTAITQTISAYEADPKAIAVNTLVAILKEHVLDAGGSLSKVQLQQHADAVAALPAAAKTILDGFIQNITKEPVAVAGNGVDVLLAHAFFQTQFGPGVLVKAIDQIYLKDDSGGADAAVNPLASFEDVQAIQSSFTAMSARLQALPLQQQAPAIINLAGTATHIAAKISPHLTFAAKMAATIRIWQGGSYVPLRKLKPVMAHPEFGEAVYEYLLELSKNYIIPNIDKIPNNSITLLQNNQSFIEAAMAGLNHEMARELLWREYPTDRRGSYFRQFWNISDNISIGVVDEAADKEKKLDIKKMHEWDGALGKNCPRTNSDNLVLVIRGELLKKYPNTVVYAQRAEYDPANAAKPRRLKGDVAGTETKFPLFKADIDPDITLFGFDLTPDVAQGDRITEPFGSTAGKDPGWFFVLKERPGQVAFGFDDFTDDQGNANLMPPPGSKPKDWNDMAWEYLVDNKAELSGYHLTFNKAITITDSANQPTWAANAADMASILLQDPALLARHAAEMLPKDND